MIRGALLLVAVLLLGPGCGSSGGAKSDAGDAKGGAGHTGAAGADGATPDAPSGTDATAQTIADGAADTVAVADVGAEAGSDGAADTAAAETTASSNARDAGAEVSDGATVEAAPLSPRYHALAVTAGSVHTCALLDDRRVKCWGVNGYGELGLGDMRTRGDKASEMGNALPFVDLGTGRTAKTIAAGRYGTCAILDDDSVKCWGLGILTGRPWPPVNVGDGPNQMGDHLAPLDLGAGRKARAVAVGFYDACIARDDRTYRCWGTSTAPLDVAATADGTTALALFHGTGAIGIFDDGSLKTVYAQAAGPTYLMAAGAAKPYTVGAYSQGGCALLTGAAPVCWGNAKTSLPPADLIGGKALAFSDVGVGCGVFADGSVRCWGGQPTTIPVGAPVTTITAGVTHFCALTTAGDVMCWEPGRTTSAAAGASVRTAQSWTPVDLGDRPTAGAER